MSYHVDEPPADNAWPRWLTLVVVTAITFATGFLFAVGCDLGHLVFRHLTH